jgi:hypothetical protein
MKFRYIIIALFVIATAVSCSKNKYPLVTGDYLIVGWSGGFVPVDAKATYYMVRDSKLWLDTNQVLGAIPQDFSGFNFNRILPADKYNKVADIPMKIPGELFAYNGAHIGRAPVDAGYTDVITFVGGHQYHWYFELDQSSSSLEVQQFVTRLNTDFDR